VEPDLAALPALVVADLLDAVAPAEVQLEAHRIDSPLRTFPRAAVDRDAPVAAEVFSGVGRRGSRAAVAEALDAAHEARPLHVLTRRDAVRARQHAVGKRAVGQMPR